ncbi:MAG: sugar ABC transporter permease, partial [Rectinemataceae bacterium]
MTKQYEFKAPVLPYLLVLPQMVIVFIFFFWPAAQAIMQSFYLQDPFGGKMIFVGFQNYSKLLADPDYWMSFRVSVMFAVCITAIAMIISLFLAIQANKRIKFASFYKTMLIWPYAVSTLVAGVIWLFMFNPNVGV